MKKSYLVLLITILLSVSTFSQEDSGNKDKTQNFNEVKINGLYLVLGAFDITYERTINEESAYGLNVFLPFDDDINDDVNYYISPYYRFYFGKKYAAGFFLEGFGMLNSTNDFTYFYNDGIDTTVREDETTDFALGIGLGGKWITSSGFVGELSLGLGRNLFNNDRYDSEIIGKVSVTVGYRF
ncbi:DUF3575 domain-containing protein [Algibacter sp.]|nr:DUF3575 domain-containing protein [Algibacter sp.]